MRRAMRKPCDISLKRLVAQLTETNNLLLIFPGYDPTKKMPVE